jgi:hypothetical protein
MRAMMRCPFEAYVCRAGILPANSVTTAANPDLKLGVKMAALQEDAMASGPLALQFRPMRVMIR